MRTAPYLLGIAIVATFLAATTPTASAAAYCVQGVANSYPNDDCDGTACVGYDLDGWQYCVPGVPADPGCTFQTDCCYSTPTGQPFYCP